MSRRILHPVHGTAQAPFFQAMRIRTRIPVTEHDRMVLEILGRYFDHLQGKDLARCCVDGRNSIKDGWAERKRVLTEDCSSRWAGYITKKSNDSWNTARRNQRRHLSDLESAISTIEKKLVLPVHSQSEREAIRKKEAENAKAESKKPRKLIFGYRTKHEHAMKRQRLDHLKSERDSLKKNLDNSVVHITRGGKQLLKNRLHLDEAGSEEFNWCAKWRAKRFTFGANGEKGVIYGNQTIRVSPDGTVDIDLPEKFSRLANSTTRGTTRYRLDTKAIFSYRGKEWLSQVNANRAVAYEVVFAAKGRIYLDASFTPESSECVPDLNKLLKDLKLRVLSVDLNHGFLAPVVLDRSGNMISRLNHIPFITEDLSASRRDGHLRQAITDVLNIAKYYECSMIVVENLGFDEMRSIGREKQASSPWFRRTVCGMPTAKFRDRLASMAIRHGIAVVGVPAAYSSIWGKEYWQDALSSKTHKISGHTAAAVVLGRRALGQRARRKTQASPGVITSERRTSGFYSIEEAEKSAGVVSYHVWSVNGKEPKCEETLNDTLRREGFGQIVRVRPKAPGTISGRSRSAKTVRADQVSLKDTYEERLTKASSKPTTVCL
ncbi:MAG: hypothetical protein M1483_00485 [Actinobacteria bacterium]|nr:hypothetical protein [Actinomycetota bacterium]MCL6104110.1 hypothetical protein [Actinomycetota bacterium]